MQYEKRESPFVGSGDTQYRVEQLENEIDRLIDSADRVKSETAMDLAQLENRQTDLSTELGSAKRAAQTLWAAVILLTAALIGAAWYGYPLLQGPSRQLAQRPAWEQPLSSVSERLNAVEEQLRGWPNQKSVLEARLTKLEKRVTANLQAARSESEQMVAHFDQILQAELDKRMAPTEARLDSFESDQKAEQARQAKLLDEIVGLRSHTDRQIATVRQDDSRDMGELSQQVASNKNGFDHLSRRLSHDRVDFEAAKDQSDELTPGVSLKVTHTNPGHQTVDGWLQLLPDTKILWIRSQDIEQPMAFLTQSDDRPFELVFTRVTSDAVVGYLLIPSQTGDDSAATPNRRQIVPTSAPSDNSTPGIGAKEGS